MFAYIVRTVNVRFELTGVNLVYGESADAIADATWERGGYRVVEVARTPYRSGDTASRRA